MIRPTFLVALALSSAAVVPAQSTSSLSGTDLFGWSREGRQSGDRFGTAVTVLERTSLGKPLVLSVERRIDTLRFLDARHGAVVREIRGPGRINFGGVLVSGDIDGDGLDDVVIASDTGVGVLDDSAMQILTHPAPGGSGPPRALATGDFDGDGYDDIAIGYPSADTAGVPSTGRIDLLSGRTRTVTQSRTGTQAYAALGATLGTGAWMGQPAILAASPNVPNASGGNGEVYVLDTNLNPVFTWSPPGDMGAGSGFLRQHGNMLAVGSTRASQTPSSGEGNVSVVDLATGATLRSFDGTQILEAVGASGAFDPSGTLYFTARGTQYEGVFYQWDVANAPAPTALFQGDPQTLVTVHGEIYPDLFGDGLPVGFLGQPGAANPGGRPSAGRVASLILGARTVFPDAHRIPAGGSARIDVRFGPARQGLVATLLASLSGVGPTPLPFATGGTIALTVDPFTAASTGLFGGAPATLGPSGDASFTLALPNDPSIAPVDMSIAAVYFGIAPFAFGASADANTVRVFDR